jgi:tetratricopeptide (TPR) repeat protein
MRSLIIALTLCWGCSAGLAQADSCSTFEECKKLLDATPRSSFAHYCVAELYFAIDNFQSAANEFRETLNADLNPRWTEVWAHIYLGKIFDITSQRDRALNEYRQALRTKDNTRGALDEAQKYIEMPYRRN